MHQAIKIDGAIFRPTGYGLTLLAALSVKGSRELLSQIGKAYDLLRKTYRRDPQNPTIIVADFRYTLQLPEYLCRQIILLLSDLGVCNETNYEDKLRLQIYESVLEKADIWAHLEWTLLSQSHRHVITNINGSFVSVSADIAFDDVIQMCPEAYSDFQKAQARTMSDPEGALTSARSMLESTIKWIHYQKNAEQPTLDGGTGKRIKACFRLLDGTGSDFERPGIKDMIQGMVAAANGLDTARNAMGDGHGKSPESPSANPRIAKLSVGLAKTVVTFLLATYESRQRP